MLDLTAVHNAGPANIAERFGFALIRARTISPCPACKAEHRSSRGHDRRGPVGLTADGLGWRCHRCNAGGDAVTFATFAVAGSERPDDWRVVREALERAGYSAAPPPPIKPALSGPAKRPPRRELLDLWTRSRPVFEDAESVAWLHGRGINPSLVSDRELARAIPPDLAPPALPAWAQLGGPWPARGYRLLLALWDAAGNLTSIHARNLHAGADPKGALPCGHQVAGTVLADSAGALMLRERTLVGPLWICEGAPDFLTAATAWGDAADPGSAVLGILSGSWTADLAARVSDGARVVIAVHHDAAGEAYVARIAATLAGRVQLERWTPEGRTTA